MPATTAPTISIFALRQSVTTTEDPTAAFVSSVPAGPTPILDASTPTPGMKTASVRTTATITSRAWFELSPEVHVQSPVRSTQPLASRCPERPALSSSQPQIGRCILCLGADGYNAGTGDWPDRSGLENYGARSSPSARLILETQSNSLTDVLFNGTSDVVASIASRPICRGCKRLATSSPPRSRRCSATFRLRDLHSSAPFWMTVTWQRCQRNTRARL